MMVKILTKLNKEVFFVQKTQIVHVSNDRHLLFRMFFFSTGLLHLVHTKDVLVLLEVWFCLKIAFCVLVSQNNCLYFTRKVVSASGDAESEYLRSFP